MPTVTRLFDFRADAETAVRQLEDAGIARDDISLIAPHRAAGEDRSFAPNDGKEGEVAADAGKGATAGGVLGGGAGLLAGLGMFAIPGIGPVVGAGWLVATAIGAAAGAVAGGAAGGIVGALSNNGVDERDAHVYAEGVRRGGTLVSVKTDDAKAERAAAVLNGFSAVDTSSRGEAYRQEGWEQFDPGADPYEIGSEPVSPQTRL